MTAVDYEAFDRWLDKQGYRVTSRRKLLADLAAVVEEREAAMQPKSEVRAKDYRNAAGAYTDFCEATGRSWPDLRVPAVGSKRRGRGGRARKMEAVSFDPSDWDRLRDRVDQRVELAACVLAILMRTGMRVSDCLRVERKALEDALRRKDKKLVVELKGGKEIPMTVQVAESPWRSLLQAMNMRGASNVAAAVSQYGDDNPEAKGSAYSTVDRLFKRLCRELDVQGRHHLHRIRRTVGVRIKEAGGDPQTVLGHESPGTTRVYTDEFRPDQIVDAVEKAGLDKPKGKKDG